MSLVLVFAMSTWFSASAVIPQLESAWSLTPTTKAWLTIAVQLGFGAGAVAAAILNLSDIVSPRLVNLGGALGASGANIGLVVADGAGIGIPLRFATGCFLASVYPPAFKLVATWFRQDRGLALGIVAGAIIVGNAAPHLVNAVGGVDWQNVIIVTSVLSASAGVIASPDPPLTSSAQCRATDRSNSPRRSSSRRRTATTSGS